MDGIFQMTAVNAPQREIEGTLLFEQINENGPIFSHDASRRAFLAWYGFNGIVLEMYDSEKPIGKCRSLVFNDIEKFAVMRVRVSRSAEETWQKVLSGTLTTYGFTYTRAVYTTIERDGQLRLYLAQYDLSSVSLIDTIVTNEK